MILGSGRTMWVVRSFKIETVSLHKKWPLGNLFCCGIMNSVAAVNV